LQATSEPGAPHRQAAPTCRPRRLTWTPRPPYASGRASVRQTPRPNPGGALSVAPETTALDELCVNTIRTLSMDAVQRANSGHPGTPMALAPLAYVLYARVMRHAPQEPHWPDRDRFVLSAGHASMLLYSTLYLTGYDVSLDDLK